MQVTGAPGNGSVGKELGVLYASQQEELHLPTDLVGMLQEANGFGGLAVCKGVLALFCPV